MRAMMSAVAASTALATTSSVRGGLAVQLAVDRAHPVVLVVQPLVEPLQAGGELAVQRADGGGQAVEGGGQAVQGGGGTVRARVVQASSRWWISCSALATDRSSTM